MSTMDVFLQHRARKLSSFAVIFQIEDRPQSDYCRILKDNGLRMPYNAFLQSVLRVLENDDVVDECAQALQLSLIFGFRQRVNYENHSYWREQQFWKQIEDDCPVKSNTIVDEDYWRGSEDIIRLICDIVEKAKRNRRTDRLMIAKCFGMRLTQSCKDFLRFWFENEADIALGWYGMKFVVR